MEKHRCKICSRRFSNGKAMGGHMRSHLAKLPIPPKIPYQATIQEQQHTESTTLTPSSSSSHAKQQHQQPNKSLSLNNFKSIYSDPSTVVYDRESESESSPKNPTRRRSRRTRKFITTSEESPPAAAEPELTGSSVSEEEDVAMSLIMLSRDKWAKKGKIVIKEETETEENSTENEDEDDEEEEDDDGDALFNARKRPCRAIYKCETCKKVFKSYQALGGHRASHKKIRTRIIQDDEEQTEWSMDGSGGGGGGGGAGGYDNSDYAAANRRIFECPFCYKVFDSGQALGGHKKVHFSNNAAARTTTKSSTTTTSSAAKVRDNWIDLNLPAPEEDEDSTVSNAEVFYQFK